MLKRIVGFYVLALTMAFAIVLFAWGVEEASAISGWTETRQTAFFTGVKPNTAYTAYFYAYHYPNDPFPYAVSYSGFSSNAFGQYKASVPLETLAQHYEGAEGPVYSVKVCLLEPPEYQSVACSPYSYVGFIPLSLWTYAG